MPAVKTEMVSVAGNFYRKGITGSTGSYVRVMFQVAWWHMRKRELNYAPNGIVAKNFETTEIRINMLHILSQKILTMQ